MRTKNRWGEGDPKPNFLTLQAAVVPSLLFLAERYNWKSYNL